MRGGLVYVVMSVPQFLFFPLVAVAVRADARAVDPRPAAAVRDAPALLALARPIRGLVGWLRGGDRGLQFRALRRADPPRLTLRVPMATGGFDRIPEREGLAQDVDAGADRLVGHGGRTRCGWGRCGRGGVTGRVAHGCTAALPLDLLSRGDGLMAGGAGARVFRGDRHWGRPPRRCRRQCQ